MLVQQYGNTHIKSYIKETDLMNGVILKRFKNFSKEYLLFIERYLIPCKYLPHQEIIYQFYHKDSGAKGLSRVRNWHDTGPGSWGKYQTYEKRVHEPSWHLLAQN